MADKRARDRMKKPDECSKKDFKRSRSHRDSVTRNTRVTLLDNGSSSSKKNPTAAAGSGPAAAAGGNSEQGLLGILTVSPPKPPKPLDLAQQERIRALEASLAAEVSASALRRKAGGA
jgi:hypothetical protein